MRGALVLLIACGVALLAPAGASAAIDCGDQLTHDVKLKANLDCSAFNDNALEIAGPGVTVDLNGHKLIGPAGDWAGIEDGGYNDFAVRDGTIKGFDKGVYVYGDVAGVVVTDVKFKLLETNDNYGLDIGEVNHLRISHVTVDNARYGMYIYDAKDAKVRHSEVTGNDPADTYGVYIGSNTENHTGVVDDVRVKGAYYGFYIYGKSSGYKVSDSVANQNGYAGIYFTNGFDPRDYSAVHNTANDNGQYGFYAAKRVSGSPNEASGNGNADCVKVNCS